MVRSVATLQSSRRPTQFEQFRSTSQVSPYKDFGNGDQFYARIDLPERRADRPRRDFLEWHIGEVFKAS
jgi:hypothetical protein